MKLSITDFQHPLWLLLIIVPIALAAGYVLAQRSKRRRSIQFGNMPALRASRTDRRNWMVHVPAIALVLGLVALVIALGAPQAEQREERNRATVMLVMDVSLSMEATDVAPSRLEAAQVAAKDFANNLTSGVNLGLVSFAGTANLLVAPTTDRGPIERAVDGLELDQRTATGEAIYSATQAVESFSASLGGPDAAPPARIVLLSDGKETVPENPDAERGAFSAARAAKEKEIPVSTISFGTLDGYVDIEGTQQGVPVDDASLEEIANLSGGEAYTASSLEELDQVYSTLEEQIGYEYRLADASRPWLIIGSILAFISAGLSLSTSQRLP